MYYNFYFWGVICIIKWGIIGIGNIADRFAKSLEQSSKGILYAIASKTDEKRYNFIKNYKCEISFDNYDELLENQNIDAVYIALPHGFHKEWSIKAILKNKAVLCEKPVTLNYKEMLEIKEIHNKNNIFFMEAMKTRFFPAIKSIKDIIKSGDIGQVTNIKADFCGISNASETSYLYDPIMGGAMLDVGVYPLSFVLDIQRKNIVNTSTIKVLNKDGIDLSFNSTIFFEDNSKADISASINYKKERTAFIYGTKGKIEVPMFNRPDRFILNNDKFNNKIISVPFEKDDFFGQIEEVNNCLLSGRKESEIMPVSESLRVMKIFDILKEENNKNDENLQG